MAFCFRREILDKHEVSLRDSKSALEFLGAVWSLGLYSFEGLDTQNGL